MSELLKRVAGEKRKVIAELGGGNFMVGRLLSIFQDLDGVSKAVVQEENTKVFTLVDWEKVEAYEKRMIKLKPSRF